MDQMDQMDVTDADEQTMRQLRQQWAIVKNAAQLLVAWRQAGDPTPEQVEELLTPYYSRWRLAGPEQGDEIDFSVAVGYAIAMFDAQRQVANEQTDQTAQRER